MRFSTGCFGIAELVDLLSMVSTADAAGVNPGSYIADVLRRVDSWPTSRIHELLPHICAVAGEQAAQWRRSRRASHPRVIGPWPRARPRFTEPAFSQSARLLQPNIIVNA